MSDLDGIIHCRDCKYFSTTRYKFRDIDAEYHECHYFTYDGEYTLGPGIFEPEDYCSKGEVRT